MGLLVALSGLDGSGKSTQCENICHACEKRGLSVDVIQMKMINSDKYLWKVKRRVKEFTTNKPIENSNELYNISSALLYKEMVLDKVLASLNSFELTILDRYIESALCYHYLKDGLYTSVENIYNELPPADINIFLDLPPNKCYERIMTRDILSPFETPEFLEKAYTFYQSKKNKFIWVDATRPVDDITQLLISTIEVAI